MQGFEEKLNKVIGATMKFSNSKYMKILSNGFILTAAVTIAGSFFNLLLSLPIDAYQNFLVSSGLRDILTVPVTITSNMVALFALMGICFSMAQAFKKDGFSTVMVGLVSFFILTPLTASEVSVDPETGEQVVTTVSNALSLNSLGGMGIFLAIIVALLASRLYFFFLDRGWKIKMPASVPPNVTSMFESMIPGAFTFVIFLVIRSLVPLTGYPTAQALVYNLLQTPVMALVSGNTMGIVIMQTLSMICWFFGIHGGFVVGSAARPVMATVNAENMAAFAQGLPCPHPEWTYGMMLMSSVGVLGLTIDMFFFSKSKRYKTLSKVALPTSIFGITEPIIFGTPMIFNVALAIPFILAPAICILLTKFVCSIGLVAMPTGVAAIAFMPLPFAMSLLNSSWTGFVWGLVLIVIMAAIFLPFFKYIDLKEYENEQKLEAETEGATEA